MTKDAVVRLAEVLAQENAALKRMDFPAAVALVPAKEAALIEVTRTTPPAAARPAALQDAARPAALQALAELAEENRVLLERAVEVQTRIVRMVAKAIAPNRPGGHYKRPNEWQPSQRTVALAVSKSV